MPFGMSFWITSPCDKESGKHLAAQTRRTYQHLMNALEACNLNTLAANKQSGINENLRDTEMSTS